MFSLRFAAPRVAAFVLVFAAVALAPALCLAAQEPPQMDPVSFVTQLLALLLAHKWLAGGVVLVGFVARLFKDDTKFPVNIPARWQPVLVVALWQLYAVLVQVQSVAAGTPLLPIVGHALWMAFFTMGLFDLVVKALFNGKDIPAFLSVILKTEAAIRGDAPPAEPAPVVVPVVVTPADIKVIGPVDPAPPAPEPPKAS